MSDAAAHAPSTSIGRAVEAFGSVSVSYESDAAVTDIEAGNFPHLVGSNLRVAFMRHSASSELAGGPNAIAGEIAREAGLQGTLIVLVGTKLGAWSNEIGEARLDELIRGARAGSEAGPPSETVLAVIRSVQAAPIDRPPWAWLVAATAAFAIGSLLVVARLSRGRARVGR